jgi:hypothetical protein
MADSHTGKLAGSHHYKRHDNKINNSPGYTKRLPCGATLFN